MAQCLMALVTISSIEPSWLIRGRRYTEPRTSPTHPLSGYTGRVSPRTATGLFFYVLDFFCKWKKCLAESANLSFRFTTAKHFFLFDTATRSSFRLNKEVSQATR